MQLFACPLIYFINPNLTAFDGFNYVGFYPYTALSLIVSVLGYTCFFLGSSSKLPAKLMEKIAKKRDEVDWASSEVIYIFSILFSLGFLWKISKLILGETTEITKATISWLHPNILFLLSMNMFHYLALASLCIFYYETQKKHGYRNKLYIAVFSFFILNGFMTSATSFIVFPLAIHLSIRQIYKPLDLKKYFLGFFILMGVISFKQFLKHFFTHTLSSFEYPLLRFVIYRLNISNVLAEIVENPTFSYGYGMIEQFLYTLRVPGFEYAIPDGNMFGRYYRLAEPTDFVTGIAISNIGDFYLHYQVLGVFFGMIFLGLLYRFVDSLSTQTNKFYVLLYAMLWPILIHGLESPVSVLLAQSVKVFFITWTLYNLYLLAKHLIFVKKRTMNLAINS